MYATIEEAKEYLAKRYSKLPDETVLAKTLQRAYDKIENIDVRDSGKDENFPRTTETTVPDKIKQANIEEAYSMLMKRTELEDNSNIKSKSDGDMSVTFVVGTLSGVQFKSRIAYDIMKRFKRKTYG